MFSLLPGYLLFFALDVFYLVFTCRFFKMLLHSNYFSKGIKRFHLVAIWLVPFVWILLLKEIMKTTPGSHISKHHPKYEPWSDAYSTPAE